MFVNRLALKNFKCLREIELRLPKLTVLTGSNSSGKSSVLASLLGALQTSQFPLYYSPNGEYVNLGDFREIVFRHDRRKSIEISLELEHERLKHTHVVGTYVESPTRTPALSKLSVNTSSLALEIHLRRHRYDAVYKYSTDKDHMALANRRTDFKNAMQLLTRVDAKDRHTGGAITNFIESIDKPAAPNGTFTFESPSGYLKSITKLPFALFMQLSELPKVMSSVASRFNYLGSFRHAPRRTYYQASRAVPKVGPRGENYIEQISEWQSTRDDNFKALIAGLTSLKLASSIDVTRMRGGRFDLLVKPFKNGLKSSLVDVGFGVSQFMPILVADIQLGKKATLAISQPETHLHPSVQADFADYLVRRIKSDDKRYIIETHSEYFLNRLRLLVAKGELDERDLETVFLTHQRDASHVSRIRFKRNGQIDGAPKQFFETYMIDVMKLAVEASD